jgi:hypothetical protein
MLLRSHQIEFDGRWVRGHQKSKATPAWLNAYCDLLARQRRVGLRDSRDSLDQRAKGK